MSVLPKLSASRSRSEFFRHLGWREDSEQDKRLYAMMMDEAAQGRQRTCQDPSNLTPQSRFQAPPFSASMITETAKHREVQTIYCSSSPETRAIYDRGTMWEGTAWDNWIIRWCLWHVFRYRDDRNRNRGAAPRVAVNTTYAQSPNKYSPPTPAYTPTYATAPYGSPPQQMVAYSNVSYTTTAVYTAAKEPKALPFDPCRER